MWTQLMFLNCGSAEDGFLYTYEVWKECLWMKNLCDESPLKRWKPLGGVWKSSLKFCKKYGK